MRASQAAGSAELRLTAGEGDAEVAMALPRPRCERERPSDSRLARQRQPQGRARQGAPLAVAAATVGAACHITVAHGPGSLSPALVTRTGRLCVVGCMNFARCLLLCLDERFPL